MINFDLQEALQNAHGEREEILEKALAAEAHASHLSTMNDELTAALGASDETIAVERRGQFLIEEALDEAN